MKFFKIDPFSDLFCEFISIVLIMSFQESVICGICCWISNICCYFLQAGVVEKNHNKDTRFKIRDVQIEEKNILWLIYRTRAITTRGLYIHYLIFEVNFFLFKAVFSNNYFLKYVPTYTDIPQFPRFHFLWFLIYHGSYIILYFFPTP